MKATTLIILLTMLSSSPAFAREQRKSKSYSIHWRAPTLTIGTVSSGETGIGFESFRTQNDLLVLNIQAGYAGNLGTFAGDGSSLRVMSGYKRYVGDTFFLSVGGALRHVNIGAIERRENESYDSYSDHYYNAQIARISATSLGGNFTLGFQWQKDTCTIGFEVVSVYFPAMIIKADGRSTSKDTTDAEADKRAMAVATSRDVTLPRLILGFSL